MPSPDTSAQGAPVASQEAEAREAVVRAGWSFGGPNRGLGGRASLTAINKALDAYVAVIRASEQERYAAALAKAHSSHAKGFTVACCAVLTALEEAESV